MNGDPTFPAGDWDNEPTDQDNNIPAGACERKHMSDYRKATCYVCHHDRDDCRHIDLYVMGSEGMYACQKCMNAITNMVQEMSSVVFTCRMKMVEQERDRTALRAACGVKETPK